PAGSGAAGAAAPSTTARTSRPPGARRSPADVLGRLAHLPVAVLQGPLERGVDVGPLEGGEGEHGPAADRRPVARRGQDGGQPGRVADGPEGGDGGLAAERVV